MRRKIINALSVLTLAFIPFVASCSNSNTVNNNTTSSNTKTNPVVTTIDNYNDIDKYIENINNSNNYCEIPSWGGFESFRVIEKNSGNVEEQTYDELCVDVYYGITKFYSGGKYDTINNIWENNEYPIFYRGFIECCTPQDKIDDYYKQNIPLDEWENNYCDFTQEMELNVYRMIYDEKLDVSSSNETQPKSKKRLYSETKCLGYYLSSEFEFSKEQVVKDVIPNEEFITDENGKGTIVYKIEIIPKNDDYVKLLARVDFDEDIYFYDSKNPTITKDEYGNVTKTFEKFNVNGKLVNPQAEFNQDYYVSVGGLERIDFSGYNISYMKDSNDAIIISNN